MKPFPLLLAFLLLTLNFSLAQPGKLTTIKGSFPSGSGVARISLDSLSQIASATLATATVDAGGNYELSFSINRPDIFKLKVNDRNYLMLILKPGESVDVKSPSGKLGVDAAISGSEETSFLYNTIHALQPFDHRRDSLNTQYKAVLESESRDSLGPVVIQEFTKNDSLQKAFLVQSIRNKPGSLAWIFLLDKLDPATDFPVVDMLEKALYAKFPYNIAVQQYHAQIDVERKTAIGSMAPDITLPDPEGNIRKLSDLKGKVVLIDFWASWCGPCRKENPNVVNAYGKFHDKGFEIFSVSLDKDRESWLKAIANDNLRWPDHVSDLKYWKSDGAAAYGVTAIPFTVLVGRDGRIVAKKLRGEALEQKLSELLN